MKVGLVGLKYWSIKQLNLGQSNKYKLVIIVWMLLSEQILHFTIMSRDAISGQQYG